MSLWLEGMKMTKADQPPRKARKRPRTATDDEAEEERSRDRKRSEVISLARRGLPGKAVQHASSMGLAPDTPATEATMRSKFVAPPPAQSTSRRVPAPTSNEVTEAALMTAIRSFGAGVSAGPSGQRPDFYKQLVGNGDKPAVPLLLGLCNLLAAGKASAELRAFIGRVKGTALYKKAKDGSDDARPACSGDTIRRIIGKGLLATETENLDVRSEKSSACTCLCVALLNDPGGDCDVACDSDDAHGCHQHFPSSQPPVPATFDFTPAHACSEPPLQRVPAVDPCPGFLQLPVRLHSTIWTSCSLPAEAGLGLEPPSEPLRRRCLCLASARFFFFVS